MPGTSEQPSAERADCSWRARVWHLCSAVVVTAFVSAATAAAPQAAATAPLTAAQVLKFLDQSIDWYHGLNVQQQMATTATDLAILYDNRQAATQAVRLAFEFARAEAAFIVDTTPASQGQSTVLSQYQSLGQLQARFDKQVQDTQAELDGDRQKLATAGAKDRQQLQAQISELQGELDLAGARRDAVHSMLEFVTGSSANGLGATGLRAQIEALARAIPGMTQASTPASAGSAPTGATATPLSAAPLAPAAAKRIDTSGIWNLAADAFALAEKIRSIASLMQQTAALEASAKQLSAPYLAQLKALSSRGDELGKQADTANSSTLQDERAQLDALAGEFKRLAAAVIPLSKQAVLLELYGRNLGNWQDAARVDLRSDLKSLGLRLGSLIVVLMIVIGGADLWRRAVYRYVTDPRRRYQFLLLRRFVFWFLMAIIISFAFASSAGSIVTFAGLITAGVAVAMQGVIIAIVGYFFLIGKFGIRVGDRVQIGGVTGEVIDVGLVRFHLMELRGGRGSDGPTGRVVAFSNSIVFQVGAGLFKQIHGTNFDWHEITLTLAAQADYADVKKRLLAAVDRALADYREEIERQTQEIARTVIWAPVGSLQPNVQLRYVATGIEAMIRYPVDLKNAAEIDERMAREILKSLEQEPKVPLAAAGAAGIRLTESLDDAKS
ncbi:MAG TPA: mechanosensitive ion channel family protein [Steroidobacteraceae bacterium]|jgi:small-conductance mechanosensitive channel|nr:mechanosensitive ion channel family protein [Steroidobacteraceae bacterium]